MRYIAPTILGLIALSQVGHASQKAPLETAQDVNQALVQCSSPDNAPLVKKYSFGGGTLSVEQYSSDDPSSNNLTRTLDVSKLTEISIKNEWVSLMCSQECAEVNPGDQRPPYMVSRVVLGCYAGPADANVLFVTLSNYLRFKQESRTESHKIGN